MSGAAAKLAFDEPGSASRYSAFAHLLHALNQPLTGLQCSLELAAAQPRQVEEYSRTLQEALELVSRMRILVEALRTIAEMQWWHARDVEDFLLEELLGTAARELQPVADAKRVELKLFRSVPLPTRADRQRIQTLIFQLLESALSLAKEGTDLQITATQTDADASVTIAWLQGEVPHCSPFSREELGMLVAQHGWQAAGGKWSQFYMQGIHTCCLTMPLAGLVADDSLAGGSL